MVNEALLMCENIDSIDGYKCNDDAKEIHGLTIFHLKKQPSEGDMPYSTPSALDE